MFIWCSFTGICCWVINIVALAVHQYLHTFEHFIQWESNYLSSALSHWIPHFAHMPVLFCFFWVFLFFFWVEFLLGHSLCRFPQGQLFLCSWMWLPFSQFFYGKWCLWVSCFWGLVYIRVAASLAILSRGVGATTLNIYSCSWDYIQVLTFLYKQPIHTTFFVSVLFWFLLWYILWKKQKILVLIVSLM